MALPGVAAEYAAALDWLFSRTRAGGPRTSERAARLLAELGLAPPPLTAVVVGTNGKGSVTAMIARGLSAMGRRTGRFLSPHVEEFRERVAVDGVPVGEAAVVRFVEEARLLDATWPHGEATRPAFFEWTLALALGEARRAGADACVLEAGVGGRYDATRAVEPVDLVVLTNVDLDHMETLGSTLPLIAHDKAGAFRPGVPAVCGAVQPEVIRVVAAVAAGVGAPLHLDAGGVLGAADGLFDLPPPLEAALAGAAGHRTPAGVAAPYVNRRANARLAAAALRLLGADEEAVEAGLRAPALPARLERFVVPDARGRDTLVVLDGAHDPAAGARLLSEVGPGYALLFGALARKQGQRVLSTLAPHARAVVITEAAAGEPPTAAWPGALVAAETEAALDAALGAANETGAPFLLVAGSLYLAGLVRPILRSRGRRLADPWELLP